MKKVLIMVALFVATSSVNAGWFSSEGELRIKSDRKGATIFIDGKKKGIIGDGFTIIKVDEGDHKIRVFKHTQEWDYEGTENTFVAGKSSIEVYINTNSSPTQYRINRLKKERQRQIALDKKSGTVINNSNIMWKRCSEGQIWSGGNCEHSTDKYQWNSAVRHAKNHDYAGYSDWRIPTVKELGILIYCSNKVKKILLGFNKEKQGHKYSCNDGRSKRFLGLGKVNYRQPTISHKDFPNTYSGRYWASPINKNYLEKPWRVEFDSGSIYRGYWFGKSDTYKLRLVRDISVNKKKYILRRNFIGTLRFLTLKRLKHLILEKRLIDINAKEQSGMNILHNVLAMPSTMGKINKNKNLLNAVQFLIDTGIDVNAKTKKGLTPLSIAKSLKKNNAIIKALIDAGAKDK